MPYIKKTLDFSIKYYTDERTFWDFLCGRMSKVSIRVRTIEIPKNLLAKDYANDIKFREELKRWLYEIWNEKSKFLKN
jgi:hypothetical protein